MSIGESLASPSVQNEWTIYEGEEWSRWRHDGQPQLVLPEGLGVKIDKETSFEYLNKLLEIDDRYQKLCMKFVEGQLWRSIRTAVANRNFYGLLHGDSSTLLPGKIGLGDSEGIIWLKQRGIIDSIGSHLQQADARYGYIPRIQGEIVPGIFSISTSASIFHSHYYASDHPKDGVKRSLEDREYLAYSEISEALGEECEILARAVIDKFEFTPNTVDGNRIEEWELEFPKTSDINAGLQVLGAPVSEHWCKHPLQMPFFQRSRYWQHTYLYEYEHYRPANLVVHKDYESIFRRVEHNIALLEPLFVPWFYSDVVSNTIGNTKPQSKKQPDFSVSFY